MRHDARPQAERLEELASLLFQMFIHVKTMNQISTRVRFNVVWKCDECIMGVRGISPELANAILVKAQSSVAKFRLLRNITEG